MKSVRTHWFTLPSIAAIVLSTIAGCSSDDGDTKTTSTPQNDAEWKAQVTTKMHAALLADIDALIVAGKELQAAAPGSAWDANNDKAAIEKMRAAWVKARVAYEHTEGALAPLFPEIDGAIDARYEDYLDELGGKGDPDPFDGEGVTGMHAIERILWSDAVPAYVKEHEQTELGTKGYAAPAFPATNEQAASFKNKLVQQFIDDATKMRDQWKPQSIDIGGAFTGLIALMNEQLEKVNKASSSEEESRYSQRTMADIRANLEGTEKIYALFQPWILTKNGPAGENGKDVDASILAGFKQLRSAYSAVSGDAVPQPPATWKSEEPESNTQADKDSAFGKLFFAVHAAADVKSKTSIVSAMNGAGTLVGFEAFKEE